MGTMPFEPAESTTCFRGIWFERAREVAMLELRRDDEIYEADVGWFNARWHLRATTELILVDVALEFRPVGVRAARA
jgi:hypothetical protein